MKNATITIIFLCFFMTAGPATAALTCNDVDRDNKDYHENMEHLAHAARFPRDYYNRYQEGAVGYICSGDENGLAELVDYGYVKGSVVAAIKEVLGKDGRSERGKAYGYSKRQFSAMGLCSACADNVAQFYTRKPASQCGKLAKNALEGNPRAVDILREFPSYCKWQY